MKKTITLAIVALMAVSCTEFVPQPMTFSATTENNSATRALIDSEAKQLFWESTDRIGVFDVNATPSNTAYHLVSGSGTANATFSCNSAPSSETGYYALYPYDLNTELVGTKISGVTISDKQYLSSTLEQHDPEYAIMAACSNGGNLAFKNVCAYIKFHVGAFSEGIKEIRITTTGGACIAGSFSVSFQDGVPVVSDVTGSGKVSLKPWSATFAEGDYYIAVIPQTLEGFTISFIGASHYYWRTTSKTATVGRGKILNLGSFDGTNTSSSSIHSFIGSGTAADPYQISSMEDLVKLERLFDTEEEYKDYWDRCYRQVCDIDMDRYIFSTIGANYNSDNPYRKFKGVYDGGGFTISNLEKTSSGTPSKGLFCVAEDATFKNMTVSVSFDYENPSLTSTETSYGGIVGTSDANDSYTLFENCTINGSMKVKGADNVFVGGFTGLVNGHTKFVNCTNNADIHGVNVYGRIMEEYRISVGGFIGCVKMGRKSMLEFDRCRNTGNITVESTTPSGNAGGFIGEEEEFMIENDVALQMKNCINKGNVTATTIQNVVNGGEGGIIRAAGFVACHNSDGYSKEPFIYNCANIGNISAYAYDDSSVGGFMAYCYDEDTRFRACANCGSLTATEDDPPEEGNKAAFCAYSHTFFASLNIKHCLMRPSIPMAEGNPATDYEGCAAVNEVTAAAMNQKKVDAGLTGSEYCTWVGSNLTLDLDF